MTDQLITQYRPDSWAKVVGHKEVVTALRRAINEPSHPHSFLFTGGGGTGKTTMARLIAADVGAEVIEIIASVNSGVDDMRAVVELGAHVPLSGAGKRMVIIDECHRCSKQAWDALLRIMEEPPPYLYFALCTTEPHKVPATIQQRCYPVVLKAVDTREIGDLLEYIIIEEGWEIADSVFSIALQECEGSPRKAISLLQSLRTAKNAEEAGRIISLEHGETEPSKVLSRMLWEGSKDWDRVQRLLKQIDEDGADFEQVYIGVCRYMIAVMKTTRKEADAARAFEVLNLMTIPANSFDPKAVFFAAVGRVFWS